MYNVDSLLVTQNDMLFSAKHNQSMPLSYNVTGFVLQEEAFAFSICAKPHKGVQNTLMCVNEVSPVRVSLMLLHFTEEMLQLNTHIVTNYRKMLFPDCRDPHNACDPSAHVGSRFTHFIRIIRTCNWDTKYMTTRTYGSCHPCLKNLINEESRPKSGH